MFTGGDRSIRKIPVATGHRGTPHHTPPGEAPHPRQRKSRTSMVLWVLLAVLACAVAGLLLSTLFEKADVTITIKEQVVALPAHMMILEDVNNALSQAGKLGYTWVLVKSIPEGFIPIQGSLSGGKIAVINPDNLARDVAEQEVSSYKGEPVLFTDPSLITASVATSTPTFGHLLVALTAASSTMLEWRVDTDALGKALVGKNRSDFASIVKTFGPGIIEARLSMRPFWKLTLPSDESKLLITTTEQAATTSSSEGD